MIGRIRRSVQHIGITLAAMLLVAAMPLRAQVRAIAPPDTGGDPLGRALAAEDRGDMHAAAAAYRQVLQLAMKPGALDGDRISLAILGLERIWSEIGARDSILPVVEQVIRLRRNDPIVRGIQLRQLMGMGRDADVRAAYLDWRRAAPTDAAPFREYSRLLISANRAKAADSVLTDATRILGGGAIAGELAQLHVALQRWQAASAAFREALRDEPWLETSALFALSRAPVEARDSIREVLRADPVLLAPRRLLSVLELSWGEPRRAWAALSSVKADDSTAAAWRAFGERAELAESWVVARDVWLAVLERQGGFEAQLRAADAALKAGDPEGSLAIARRKIDHPGIDNAQRVRALLPVEVASLGLLGRAAEAERRIEEHRDQLDVVARRALARPMVSAWLRAGDLDKAREAVQLADLGDDDEIVGWLALYDGDLATARKHLVRAESRNTTLNDVLGLLARTRVDSSPAFGAAFMMLARHDSVRAASQFALLAGEHGDAAPALLLLSARLEAAVKQPAAAARAQRLWERITVQYPKSPEAPEALLSWARALRDAGNVAAAKERLEQLLIGYPDSALLPQARRELERLNGQVPPDLSHSARFPHD